jgi:hypothetical protein
MPEMRSAVVIGGIPMGKNGLGKKKTFRPDSNRYKK